LVVVLMEISPMATELFPIISTRDLARCLGFYRDLLGGTVTYEFAGADGEPAYVGLTIGSSSLGIGADPSVADAPAPRPIALWISVADCDATVARLRAAGVRVTAEPELQAWGERVARVLDPDANELIIGSRT
jgi:lactoylglutathione lyase